MNSLKPRSTGNEHAIPRKGYVLSTAVEELALPIRHTVKALQKRAISKPLREAIGILPQPQSRFYSEREAWHIVAICLTFHKATNSPEKLQPNICLERFFQRTDVNAENIVPDLIDGLSAVVCDAKVNDLLPYIIDAHGPGSRLSVKKSPGTAAARAHKKANGVFYTPADVANYMTTAVLSSPIGREPPTILDPAVGTGVFLRAALGQLSHKYSTLSAYEIASNFLFGSDIDAFALDGAAFVLLNDVLEDLPVGMVPAEAWQRLRSNLVEVDGLSLDRENGSLGRHFPALQDGADIILGNPPYAAIGPRSDMAELTTRLKTLTGRDTANLYPLFVEQIIRLGRTDGSGAMVIPLSLACNTGEQFRACRELIERTPGLWRFAFFDREPHALFGEDVKTRNTIILRNSQPGERHRVMAGPLRRWRGTEREALLSSIDFTDISSIPIQLGIPKIRGAAQAQALSLLEDSTTLGSFILTSGKTELRKLPNAHKTEVLVGPTAYNFLNVARATVLPLSPGEQLSENALHCLTGLDEEVSAAIYAILSSDFSFWWWYVQGDGFHVNLSHLLNLPVGDLDKKRLGALADLGQKLWDEARRTPLKSSNRGRVTFAFPTRAFSPLRQEIDALLRQSLGHSDEFAASLKAFVGTVVDARIFQSHNQK
ncbi:MAG TPA: N-6 DNA methylase [Alphaproteobacteria bacterium]|nr:N-6 DNA methylase [Alphaproteobacteria bacterium]